MTPEQPESRGALLRREILEMFVLNPAERLLLDEAAAHADTLERIKADMATAPTTVTGSAGQTVAHPLLREMRETAARLASLLESLQLPGRDETVGRSSTSLSAQRAANMRWGRRRHGAVA